MTPIHILPFPFPFSLSDTLRSSMSTDRSFGRTGFSMSAGQIGDYLVAAALLNDMPKAQEMLGDSGYDADWFRDTLQAKAFSSVSRAADRATSRYGTIGAATGVTAASRSCSFVSRTGGESPPVEMPR